MNIPVKLLRDNVPLPRYAKSGDSGFDFYVLDDIIIRPDEVVKVPTGMAMAIPEGYELQVRLRSSVAFSTELIVANAPGTVDSGYRGEICIIVRNVGHSMCHLKPGDRIAQGVIAPVFQAHFQTVKELPESERGKGGFGSSGK